MKKTLIIALSGMMLFAFAQCGGNGGGKVAKGSQQFQDNMEKYKKVEEAINDAKSCEELGETLLGMLFMSLADDKDYAEEERMTEAEKAELEKYGEKFEDLFHKKADKRDCRKGQEEISYIETENKFRKKQSENTERETECF